MQLTLVTILFLGLAVLVALGILFFVAAPHLRARDRDDPDGDEQKARDRRHTSRTGR